MNLPVASWALVRYNIDGEALWHERHILLKCSSLTTLMAVETPDGDVYLEDLRHGGGGGDIREVEFTDHRGEVVPGCDQCYRFSLVQQNSSPRITTDNGNDRNQTVNLRTRRRRLRHHAPNSSESKRQGQHGDRVKEWR